MKKFISDVKKELNDLFAEKEANREMKLIKRLADKKIKYLLPQQELYKH